MERHCQCCRRQVQAADEIIVYMSTLFRLSAIPDLTILFGNRWPSGSLSVFSPHPMILRANLIGSISGPEGEGASYSNVCVHAVIGKGFCRQVVRPRRCVALQKGNPTS